MRTKEFDENEILEKAIAIFRHKGYSATSLNDLIDGLGIGRSSIYHAFGDKHTLYKRALEYYQETATERYKDVFNTAPSFTEGIRAILRFIIADLRSDTQQAGCFNVNAGVELAPHDAEINKMVCENDRAIETFLYNAIKNEQANGRLSGTKNARALARFLCNSITGMRVYAKIKTDKPFFEDVINTTLSIFD